MGDWELVLYKYANFSALESSARQYNGPAPLEVPLPVRVRYRRGTNTFAFSLSIDQFFPPIFHLSPLLFSVLSRRYTRIVLFLSISK